VEREKRKKWRGFGRIEAGMEKELSRRGEGRDRKQLAYATPMPQSSEAINSREKRTSNRSQLGVK
jgi:hypothetical protein